jgi:hypothetical protein
VPARQKDVACHLDNTRLMRTFPQSPNAHDRNGVFHDGSVKRPEPGSEDYYLVTPFGEGPRDLLAGCGRAPADGRIFVVNKEETSHGAVRSNDRLQITNDGRFADDRLQMTDDK